MYIMHPNKYAMLNTINQRCSYACMCVCMCAQMYVWLTVKAPREGSCLATLKPFNFMKFILVVLTFFIPSES